MKISTSLFLNRAAGQIGDIQGSLSKIQEQLSTGKEIVRPSDAPDKAALVKCRELGCAVAQAIKEKL